MTASEQHALIDGGETPWSYDQPSRLGRAHVSLVPSSSTYPSTEELVAAPEPIAVRIVRRTADIIGAVVGLILMAPLLLAVVVANRLDSKGPVLFRQARVGRGGTTFTMVKFRTMFTDAEQRLHELETHNESVGGVLFKMQADPRVTRVGATLRRSNLDELPQLLNVLRGDMSLVGPRPLPLRDCRLLATLQPLEYWSRHAVRPGITGEWQIRRAHSDYWHMIQLDMEYLRARSLRHDGFIALKTVVVLVKAAVGR